MNDASLVSVSITSNSALSQRLRDDLASLRSALDGRREDVEIADVPLGGLGSLDPDTLGFLLEIARTAGGAVAGVAAKELCSWLWMRLRGLSGPERPAAVALTIGQTRIDIPAEPTPGEVDATVRFAEAAIRATAKVRETGGA